VLPRHDGVEGVLRPVVVAGVVVGVGVVTGVRDGGDPENDIPVRERDEPPRDDRRRRRGADGPEVGRVEGADQEVAVGEDLEVLEAGAVGEAEEFLDFDLDGWGVVGWW